MQNEQNVYISKIERSYQRVVIGKPHWKTVVLSSVMLIMEVVVWREEGIEKLQRQQNTAIRIILGLGAPRYATIAGMRGEFGIGTVVVIVVE